MSIPSHVLSTALAPERVRTPALVYDAAAIDANARALASIGEATGTCFLFAVKSFPHPSIVASLARRLGGFDVSNATEARLASRGFADAEADVDTATRQRRAPRVLSLCAPGLHSGLLTETLSVLTGIPGHEILVSCETPAQAAAVARTGCARVMIRLDSGSLLAPLFEGTKQRPPCSRFGVPALEDHVAPVLEASGDSFEGFHLHHGFPQHNAPEDFLHFARGMTRLARALGVEARTRNLGGGLWKMGFEDLMGLCSTLRAEAAPAERICFEPGRVLTRGAGYAVGTVVSARSVPGREIRVLDISRVGHMKWSNSAPRVDVPVANGGSTRLELVGPTCYEDDCFLRVPLAAGSDARSLLPEGERIVFEGVTGYSAAWNHSFNGLPEAAVVIA